MLALVLLSNPGVLKVFICPYPPVEPDQLISYPNIAVKSLLLSYSSAILFPSTHSSLIEPSAIEAFDSLSNEFE